MTVRIAPSLLSADFARLADEVGEVERAGADLLHLDLMDGHFVPNLTFGPPLVKALVGHCGIPLDAHLMVTDPDELVPALADSGVSRVSVHVETCPHLHRTLAGIREHGMSAGVAVNPATPLEYVEAALDWVDFVLVMSVNPGFGGQEFIPESTERVRRLRAASEALDIAVDGGVDARTAPLLVKAGATTLVAGSAVFGTPDRRAAIAALRSAVDTLEHGGTSG